MPNVPSYPQFARAARTGAALLLVGGCFNLKTFPRRSPGSDMALPPPTRTVLLESLIGCATKVDTERVGGARTGAACRTASGDTVPDHRRPTPPPTTVP